MGVESARKSTLEQISYCDLPVLDGCARVKHHTLREG